jgi:hypothetical protein
MLNHGVVDIIAQSKLRIVFTNVSRNFIAEVRRKCLYSE